MTADRARRDRLNLHDEESYHEQHADGPWMGRHGVGYGDHGGLPARSMFVIELLLDGKERLPTTHSRKNTYGVCE